MPRTESASFARTILALVAGGVQAQFALVAALPGQVDAQGELRRPGAIDVVEAGAERIQVVGASSWPPDSAAVRQ